MSDALEQETPDVGEQAKLKGVRGGGGCGLPSSQTDQGTSSSGNNNGGVPTLTTPTLTPTTLKNIEQMFADSDPHEHQNAAGFVPPIISPTSAPSSSNLGLDLSCESRSSAKPLTPSPLDIPLPSPLLLSLASPGQSVHLTSPTFPGFPSPSFNNKFVPLATRLQARTSSIQGPFSPPGSSSNRPQLHNSPEPDLTLLRQHIKTEPNKFLDLTTSKSERIARPQTLSLSTQPGLLKPVEKLTEKSSFPASHADVLKIPEPTNLMVSRLSDSKTIKIPTRPNTLTLKRPESLAIPSGLSTSPSPGLPAKNIEFLEKFLKAANASSPMLQTPTSAILLSPTKEVSSLAERAISPPSSPPEAPPLVIARPSSPPSKSQVGFPHKTTSTRGPDTKLSEDEDKRALRRERNKQAAARCRKRRLDLTLQLQDEVSNWEHKTRLLKEELVSLEQQKKGLESLLRHNGPCKIESKQS